MKQCIEIMRHNVTPAQFLAYVRSQLKKKGMRDVASDLDLEYFARGNSIFNSEYYNEPGRPCKSEKSVSKPYEMQTYILNWDGSCYNEICEFEFDDEKTGHGYYYLYNNLDGEQTEEQTEEQNETQTINKKSRDYHQMKIIVQRQGGFREKDILRNPHVIERDETWNDQHKVLNVLAVETQEDGYRNGFAVDLVTMSICG